MIGCFSAASNVTGILTDTIAVTACLHRNGALAFWDYATAGIEITKQGSLLNNIVCCVVRTLCCTMVVYSTQAGKLL